MTARMRQFERTVAEEIPGLCEPLDEPGRTGLRRYVTQLQDWMASIVNRHRHCDRFAEKGLIRRYGTGPRPATSLRGSETSPGWLTSALQGLFLPPR
jgi:germacradienol/geosmin synthase